MPPAMRKTSIKLRRLFLQRWADAFVAAGTAVFFAVIVIIQFSKFLLRSVGMPDKGYSLFVTSTVFGLLVLAIGIYFFRLELKKEKEQKRRINALEEKVQKEPNRVKPVWDLARVTLESYFQRNLKQVHAIFYVSNLVMLAGFGVIVWGVRIAISDPNRIKISLIASASGILTEFISLTFMAIYRSTMSQANEYVAVLERINTVGMAVQILDSMDKEDKESAELKNITRVDIIRLLLTPPDSALSKPRSRRNNPEVKTQD